MPIRTNRGRVAVYRRLWGWPMRSPRHLLATVLVVFGAVLFIGLMVPKLTGAGARQAGAAGNTGGSATTSAQPGAPGGAGPAGAPAPGAKLGTNPVAPSSSLPTRLTSPPQTPTSAPPAPQALDVASLWAKAWVNHPQGVTAEQWLNGLRPYTTEEQLAVMSTVDPANIPATKVTGDPAVKNSYTTSVEATIATDGGTLDITVIATPAGWRVAHYDRAA